MIHAAIFDMDGLLFDTERLCCQAWTDVSRKAGYVMDESLFRRCVGRNNRDTKALVLQHMGIDFPYERFNDEARLWMRSAMEEKGPPEKDGIREIFSLCDAAGIPIALATSTSESSARWMIQKAGLTDRFTAWAFGSEVEQGKPAPDIFLLAMNRLGVTQPDTCVVFEDSSAGICAAHSAGMRVVFIPDMINPASQERSYIWKEYASLLEAAADPALLQ